MTKKQTSGSGWKQFDVYPGCSANIVAAYRKVRGNVEVKLVTKVSRGQYYSFLNEAGLMAEELCHK